MKILKKTFIMLFALIYIFAIAGCQKDSVGPANQPETKMKSSTPKENASVESKKEQKSDNSNKAATNNKKAASSKKLESEKENVKLSKSTTEKSQQSPAKAITNTNKNTNKNSNNNSSATKKSNTKTATNKPEPQLTVTISIISKDLKKTLVAPKKVEIHNGDTVLSVTRQVISSVSVRGSGATAYVEGIGDLYEFDHGPLSGWTVAKNGIKLDRSVGIKTVKNGDSIVWNYTTDYTKDSK
ncbi:DUF4430 domain-containing protein [Bacillus sp. FJAT-49736]|uniref:DUF4430 domain-containing protein n=1 Tax=Bacillus sp. FJAT-49736 TaxID=2833582 RepID=UPI001BC9DC55|nr:DUF4430 domain-containing protein [Bacillus sp. FJAT-49736]MBS4174010.1 DUF4430 domain-containing protein [Bacillus sp. FJAT-49736]